MADDMIHEFRPVQHDNSGKEYLANERFRLRVFICSFISMLVVICTATALIIQIANFSTFRAQKYELAEGDMRLVSVSTAFCEGITLGKDSPIRKLWILSSSQVSPLLRRSNLSTEVFVSRLKYWYKGFYLLEGSSVTVNAMAESTFKLFIFKGRNRLDEWLDQHEDSIQKSGVESNRDITSPSTQISYVLNIHETSNYYILFKHMSGKEDLTKLKLNLTINRRTYDLDSSVYSCSARAEETCSARLLFGSSEVGVVEVTGSMEPSYLSNALVCTWRCEPRIWFYLAVFAGFILFSLVVSLALYFIVMNRKRVKYKQLQRIASQRREVIERTSRPGSVACSRSNSFGNRSLSGSIRRPPSRTPSTRSLGNQVSRTPRLKPVVTSMYTGHLEDSGHDTDEENKRTEPTNRTRPRRTRSVESMRVERRENLSRKPSFSTFQTSEDESRDARESAHGTRRGLRDRADGKSDSIDRARKHSLDTLSDRPKMRDKIPNGTLPKNFLARGYSSDDDIDRLSRTLPRNRGNSSPIDFHSQLAPEFYLLPHRPASLPSLQQPDTGWGRPTDLDQVCHPLLNGAIPTNGDADVYGGKDPLAPHEVKLRAHSGKRRDREIGWSPRLSMVSEV